jgi:hypothetical protein
MQEARTGSDSHPHWLTVLMPAADAWSDVQNQAALAT